MGFDYEIFNLEGTTVDILPIKWILENYNYLPTDIQSFINFCNKQINELSNKLIAIKQDIAEIKYDLIKNLDKHNNIEDLLKYLKLKLEIYEVHPSKCYDTHLLNGYIL